MPRYHFNVYDDRNIIDDVGTELPDWKFARREAVRYSGAVLEDEAERISLGEEWRMEVTDSTGLTLFYLNFRMTAALAIPHETELVT
jgi:hypothetical protein